MAGGEQELLAGVHVLDLTDASGAFAARVLADLGAEVVRVEPAGGGRGRSLSPRAPDGAGLPHLHRNVGKLIAAGDDSRNGMLAGADIAFCSDATAGAEPAAIAARHPHI